MSVSFSNTSQLHDHLHSHHQVHKQPNNSPTTTQPNVSPFWKDSLIKKWAQVAMVGHLTMCICYWTWLSISMPWWLQDQSRYADANVQPANSKHEMWSTDFCLNLSNLTKSEQLCAKTSPVLVAILQFQLSNVAPTSYNILQATRPPPHLSLVSMCRWWRARCWGRSLVMLLEKDMDRQGGVCRTVALKMIQVYMLDLTPRMQSWQVKRI